MKIFSPFKELSKWEWSLWLGSATIVILSFVASGGGDVLNLIASLIGVTALIFVAKGMVLGQVLTVVFAVFYGLISFYFKYYGEMLTYLGMTSPIAIMSVVEWIKHPYKTRKEVEVGTLSKRQIVIMVTAAAVVTSAFYFILKALGNASLVVSTISVTTSFLASWLTLKRSPYYALAYAANDIVLIILWTVATVKSLSYLPMTVCFVAFLANDLYGFYNWQRMKKRQSKGE